MNKHPLSSSFDRIAGSAVSAVLAVVMVFLVYLLRTDILTLVIIALSVVLVAAVLAFYVLSLCKAACTPLPDEKKLLVHGFPDYTIDLADAALVQTIAYKNGGLATRTILFCDQDEQIIASVPTFFFSRQGAMAEPAARDIAAELGLSFVPSLPAWEYDKELREIHEKEEAEAQKAARKAEFQALKDKLLRRRKAVAAAPHAPEEENTDIDLFETSDGINYDAMDDEK